MVQGPIFFVSFEARPTPALTYLNKIIPFFLGGIFKSRSVQKLIYETSLELSEPFDFSSFQSLYTGHKLPLTKTTARECGHASSARTGFPTASGELSDPAFDGLSIEQKKIYTSLLVNELKSGITVGPLHYSCTWMMYLKTNTKAGSKVGDYHASDILNAIKVGLVVNAANCTINQAQDENKPSLDWFRATLNKMYETVSHYD